MERRDGADRFATAAAVSRTAFPAGATRVVVATAGNFPDALAGGPAAATGDGGPVLLVSVDELPPTTAEELARLRPEEVVVLGGAAAVSQQVLGEIEDVTGAAVTRVAGGDRFATAAAVSERFFFDGADLAYVATGANFPDALAGGAAGAVLGAPVLLVGAEVGDPAAAELRRLRPSRVVVLGGTAAVPDEVMTELVDLTGAQVERRAGVDRFATSASVAEQAFPGTASTVFLATGDDFPDALSAGPAAAEVGGPLMLVPGTCITPPVAAQITRLAPDRLVILGGTGAVARAVEFQAPC